MNEIANNLAFEATEDIKLSENDSETFLKEIEELIEKIKPIFLKAENERRYWVSKFMESRKATKGTWGVGSYWQQANKYSNLSDHLKNILNHLTQVKNELTFFEEQQLDSEYYQEKEAITEGLI